jgi:hypothetical protein
MTNDTMREQMLTEKVRENLGTRDALEGQALSLVAVSGRQRRVSFRVMRDKYESGDATGKRRRYRDHRRSVHIARIE